MKIWIFQKKLKNECIHRDFWQCRYNNLERIEFDNMGCAADGVLNDRSELS